MRQIVILARKREPNKFPSVRYDNCYFPLSANRTNANVAPAKTSSHFSTYLNGKLRRHFLFKRNDDAILNYCLIGRQICKEQIHEFDKRKSLTTTKCDTCDIYCTSVSVAQRRVFAIVVSMKAVVNENHN